MELKTAQDIAAARELVSPPGDTLLEIIEQKGISQKDLADRMGRPIKTISDIINGKTAITPETAVQLERVLNVPVQFWLAREQNYRLELEEIEQAEKLLASISWLDHFPIAEMANKGWIKSKKKCIETFEELLALLGVANAEGFERTFMTVATVRYRISLKKATNPFSLAVWLCKGEREAEKICPNEYSETEFRKVLLELKNAVEHHRADMQTHVVNSCYKAGVTVVHTDCLKNTPVSGVTRWIGNNPLIQLSHHLKTNDQYWFTFYHEAGHVLLHSRVKVYVQDAPGLEGDAKEEAEANLFAQEYLLSGAVYDEFKENTYHPEEYEIQAFAAKHRTHPAVVVGRLQRDGLVSYSWHNRLKEKVVYG